MARTESNIRRYMRRMMAQAVIKWANAREGGTWELVHVVEHRDRTEVHMESRHPLRDYGIESNEYPDYQAVKVVIYDMTEKLAAPEHPGYPEQK